MNSAPSDKPTPNNAVRLVEISADEAGQRLDNFLLRELKGVPRSHIYKLLRRGEVRVNKGRCKPLRKLQAGDVVRLPPVRIAERAEVVLPKEGFTPEIVFEDDRLLAINKPAGVAVHGGSGQSFGVIEALRLNRPEARFLELVHRLDRETSGLLLIAKRRSALRNLHEQLRGEAKPVNKQYSALLAGDWPAEWRKQPRDVKLSLRKETVRDRERKVLLDPQGQSAHSRFTLLKAYNGASLVNVQIFTGRTHQIRVHSKGIGQPIAGDSKYGSTAFNLAMQDQGLRRMFLHARQLEFSHPADGRRITIEAPLPAELQTVLNTLESTHS